MAVDPRVLDLLLRYEELAGSGQSVTPEALCAECPELLEEVRRRIEGLGALDDLLEGPAARTVLQADPPGRAPAGAGAAPVGYELLEEIGRGGMGVVFKARQVKADRLVALKMLLAGSHAGPAALARFRTEAEAIARLQHPNIVAVYEVGEHGGQPFFSLEFCPGGSLDRKLGGTPLPPQQAARLVETLARAMQAAHQARVIHRDLKPATSCCWPTGRRRSPTSGWPRSWTTAPT
jgi:serine/threonine-protein kinase